MAVLTLTKLRMTDFIKLEKRFSTCVGCGLDIFDQFILRVAPDLEWHAACLKCDDCKQFLDERCTCFVRDGKTYCKRDYIRLFGTKCSKCRQPFSKSDYVMRARSRIYHVHCFHCSACGRSLTPGEEFALRGETLFCRLDIDLIDNKPVCSGLNVSNDSGMSHESFRSPSPQMTPLSPPLTKTITPALPLSQPPMSPSPLSTGSLVVVKAPSSAASTTSQHSSGSSCSSSSIGGGGNGSGCGEKRKKDQKTTRVRTVLNEKQLHTLRTCYNANPRPDALMKEQLVEMTGLSPRVIRVWFQNKRCKDKKKQILIKQLQQQQEKNQALNGIRMHGVGPMIAGSPVRHDVNMIPPIEIAQFQQNSALWKLSNEYAPLHPDHVMDPEGTPFQQLMHGFGDPNIDPTGPLSFLSSHMGGDGDLASISPAMAASDLSSPSCSE